MSLVMRVVTTGLILCRSLFCFPASIQLQRHLQHLRTIRDNTDGKPPYYCYQHYTARGPNWLVSGRHHYLDLTALYALSPVFIVAFENQYAVVITANLRRGA